MQIWYLLSLKNLRKASLSEGWRRDHVGGREKRVYEKETRGENPFPVADWIMTRKNQVQVLTPGTWQRSLLWQKGLCVNVTMDFETERFSWIDATTSVLMKGQKGMTKRGSDETMKQRLEWLGNTWGMSEATRSWQRQRNRLSLGASRRKQPCKVQLRLLPSRTVRE